MFCFFNSMYFFFSFYPKCVLGWLPIHLDTGYVDCCFHLKEQPSVSLALPPEG